MWALRLRATCRRWARRFARRVREREAALGEELQSYDARAVLAYALGVAFAVMLIAALGLMCVRMLDRSVEEAHRAVTRRGVFKKHAKRSTMSHFDLEPSYRFGEGGIKQLDDLLLKIARDNIVILSICNSGYAELCFNFVCHLTRLEVSNYVILATDRDIFSRLTVGGAQAFYMHDSEAVADASSKFKKSDFSAEPEALKSAAAFGSAAFIRLSKLKSRLVLDVLALGYDVVFSDVDVVWLRSDVCARMEHQCRENRAEIAIQSDALVDTDQSPNFNINSGLYFAKATSQTISAFKAIVKHGALANLSEQKSFNHILCGAFKNKIGGPGARLGESRCLYRSKAGDEVSIIVLGRDEFPNGSDASLWAELQDPTERKVTAEREISARYALHANNINSTKLKVEMLQRSALWYETREHSRSALSKVGRNSASSPGAAALSCVPVLID